MPPSPLRIAYLAHTFRSDWNNGNAHFLRGLLRSLGKLGHVVTGWEPANEWSVTNLRAEQRGEASLAQFDRVYPDLDIRSYGIDGRSDGSSDGRSDGQDRQPDLAPWRERLRGVQVVVLHEWNPPALARLLLQLRPELGFQLLFHDTHHRASSSPESFAGFGLDRFNGILAFGEALRAIYRERFGLTRVWTLHEAADTEVFAPDAGRRRELDVVWIGNWGEGERSDEIRRFLLEPLAQLRANALTNSANPRPRAAVYGVRYPPEGLAALAAAGVEYRGYLPNLEAPAVYASARLTVHIPRQQYSEVMTGIPTIRVFEALACGIPLLSAPWQDTEHLFRPGDFTLVHTGEDMAAAMNHLLEDPDAALAQARRGLETVLTHHTCDHRAREFSAICQELTA